MSSTEIKLYDFLRKDLKLEDTRAKIFSDILNESIYSSSNKNIAHYKSEIQTDLFKLEIALRTDLKENKTEMIKWFFAFFFSLVIMMLGLYATILLK